MAMWLTICGLALALASGCSSAPSRPPGSIYTGDERPDPTRPPRPDAPLPREEVEQPSEQNAALVPRHLAEAVSRGEIEGVARIAVLLPFSSQNAAARRQADGLMAGIEAALFEAGAPNIVLIPKDTGGIPATAKTAVTDALNEGAQIVLGPLFNHNVQAISDITRQLDIPVLSFSTDRTVAGNGTYLVSVPPEEEVARIVDFANQRGIDRFAMFGPENAYGRRILDALNRETALRGAQMIASRFYTPGDLTPTEPAQILAEIIQAENEIAPGQVAVLIPDQGNQLRAVAPLLEYYDVEFGEVKLLGTGLWNNASVWREPTLAGGVFAAPNPGGLTSYSESYRSLYGETPPSLSSLGLDAGLMALVMLKQGAVNRASIERPDGFVGTNGLFRFRADGTPERGLAVMQVTPNGKVRIVDAPPRSFAPDGS